MLVNKLLEENFRFSALPACAAGRVLVLYRGNPLELFCQGFSVVTDANVAHDAFEPVVQVNQPVLGQ